MCFLQQCDIPHLSPNERQPGTQLLCVALQEFENVGENADRQREVDGPLTEVQELGEQLEGSQTMSLRIFFNRRKSVIMKKEL